MIVEQRTYTLHPGAAAQYLKHYQEKGLAVQLPILGHLVGWFTSEIGTLNQIVHMWAYTSLDDRAARRAKLGAEPAWHEYLALIRPLVVKQESCILLPAPFSPWYEAPKT